MAAIDTTRSIGFALRRRRIELGISQAEAARRAGVSRKFVVDAEAGKDTMEVGRLLALLTALDLTLEVIDGETSTPDRRSTGTVDLDAVIRDYLTEVE